MKTLVLAPLALGLALAVALPAAAQEVPAPLKTTTIAGLGTVLTGPNGMTLYTFANDREPGQSACAGQCAENWPPFGPAAGAPPPVAPLSVITRGDGSRQYAWKGKPLYYWKKDAKPGDARGHKVRGVWFVAQP